VLNAKNHLREAEIIAQAGKKGAVTVATNMAGRGVDIILGGSTDGIEKNSKEWKQWQKDHDEVVFLGGLYVIGTERHESRRIDNQLRGRSGRQGDPGKSQFYVALDDEIMRLFGGDTIAGLMTRFNMPEDVPLEHPLVSRAIQQAQIKVEGFNFDIRKHLVEYDDVLNKQREIIYAARREILNTDATKEESVLAEQVQGKITQSITATVTINSSEQEENNGNEKIIADFSTILPFDDISQKQLVMQLAQMQDISEKENFLNSIAKDVYEKREKELGIQVMREVEKFVMLSVYDNLWTDHLDAIENLRQGIGLRGYGQRDPLVEYKNEAFRMFENLIAGIDDEIVHRIYKIQVQQAPVLQQPVDLITNTPDSEISNPIQKKTVKTKTVSADPKAKLGRNDPCWCGSGKKYKKCHWPN
jgi:preprotein translocase subunit SecA